MKLNNKNYYWVKPKENVFMSAGNSRFATKERKYFLYTGLNGYFLIYDNNDLGSFGDYYWNKLINGEHANYELIKND